MKLFKMLLIVFGIVFAYYGVTKLILTYGLLTLGTWFFITISIIFLMLAGYRIMRGTTA